jgi:hypothetical protein
VVVS